jgi:hypothetical protein
MSDNKVTAFQLDTSVPLKRKNDILDVSIESTSGSGKLSRMAQRKESNDLRESSHPERNIKIEKESDRSQIIELMRESIANNRNFFDSLNSAQINEQKVMKDKVSNAEKLWDLYKDEGDSEEKSEAKHELKNVLREQKDLLNTSTRISNRLDLDDRYENLKLTEGASVKKIVVENK